SISGSLNDEDRFVVQSILFTNLPQTIVFFCGMFQHGSANVSRGLRMIVPHHIFKVLTLFFIESVIDTIGIKKKNIAGTHQRDLRYIRRIGRARAKLHRKITLTIWMIDRDLETQW